MDISGDESLFCNRGRAGQTVSCRGESDDSEACASADRDEGEFIGIREMRKHVAWYTAGMPHSAGLRRESNNIESYADLEKLLERIIIMFRGSDSAKKSFQM